MLRISVLAGITFLVSIITSAVIVYSSSESSDIITSTPISATPSPSEIFKDVFASSNTKNLR